MMNKKSRAFRRSGLLAIALGIFGCFYVYSAIFFSDSHVFAVTNVQGDQILKKALVQGLRKCYSSTYMNNSVKSSSILGDATLSNVFTSKGRSDGVVAIPNNAGNSISDGDLSCSQVITGYREDKGTNSVTGVLSAFGKGSFSALSNDGSHTNLVGIGYVPKNENAGTPQIRTYTIGYNGTATGDPNATASPYSIEVKFGANNEIISTSNLCSQNGYANNNGMSLCVGTDTAHTRVSKDGTKATIGLFGTRNGYADDSQGTEPDVLVDFKNGTVSVTYNNNATNCGDKAANGAVYSCSGKTGVKYTIDTNATKAEDPIADSGQVTDATKYVINNYDESRKYFINNTLGASAYDKPWTADEVYSLYYNYYIAEVLRDKPSDDSIELTNNCVDSLNNQAAEASGKLYVPSGGKWCEIKVRSDATIPKKLTDGKGRFTLLSGNTTQKSKPGAEGFKQVIKGLMAFQNGLDISDTPEYGDLISSNTNPSEQYPGGSQDSSSDGDSSGDLTIDECYKNAESLGWILCPVIKATSGVANTMYSKIEHTYLEVGKDMVGDTTKSAWSKFRNLANTVFAIFLVIVILSQLTGIGISNYGIKKALPKLIMVVVLVNLSFVLCQVAVDISNILGSGLENLFNSFTKELDTGEPTAIVGGMASSLFGSVVGIGAVTVVAVANWSVWLFPFLLLIFTVIISVFFFFLTLGVRQAAIVVLIVLCPVAIACYALPNAKPLFDKWFKAFKGILLVYPICGILMGGGKFVSKLLLASFGQGSDDVGTMFKVTAVLINVVPFFFIPAVIKNSLNAFGGLGNMISRLGNNVGRGITGAIRRSEGYRNMQRSASAVNDRMLGNTLDKGLKHITRGRGTALSRMINDQTSRSLAKREGRYNAYKAENEDAINSSEGFATEGSDVLNKIRSKSKQQAAQQAAASAQATLDMGTAASYFGHGQNGILSMQDYGAEHLDIIRSLQSGTNVKNGKKLTDEDRARFTARRDALQNTMSKDDNTVHEMAKNFHDLVTASGFDNTGNNAVYDAANQLFSSGSISNFDKTHVELPSLLKGIVKRDIGGTLSESQYEDKYALGGLSKMQKDNFSRMDNTTLQDMVTKLSTNEKLRQKYGAQVAGLANSVMSDPLLSRNLKEENVPLMRQLRSLGLSGGATAANDDGSPREATAAAKVFGNLGVEGINDVNKYMTDTSKAELYGSDGNLTEGGKKIIRDIAENACIMAETKTNISQPERQALQRVIETANNLGVKNLRDARFELPMTGTFNVPHNNGGAPIAIGDFETTDWNTTNAALRNSIHEGTVQLNSVPELAQKMSQMLNENMSRMTSDMQRDFESTLASTFSMTGNADGSSDMTVGMKSMFESSAQTLNDVASWVKSVNNGNKFTEVPTDAAGKALYERLQNLSSNVDAFFAHSEVTSDKQEGAMAIRDALKSMGIVPRDNA